MRFLPYLVGGFMLLPFLLWAGLWAFVFPGPKPGLDVPIVTALIAVSLPLVLWHLIAGLAYVANSMAGRAGEEAPVWGPARWALRAMPAAALAMGAGSTAILAATGEGALTAASPLAAGALMAWIMAIAARPAQRSSALHLRPAAVVHAAMGLLGRAVLATPVLGGMLREAGRDPHRGAPLLALNVMLLLAVGVWLFGFEVLVIPAMLATPFIFYALFALTD
ncbi:hypothetical protein DDZ18_00745 [Marinicauda salina]|uniref:Uncharacterized protein n=1 Tax=Marinicauda salina TaxID=2135793 RepID=A0A2U2BW24_9PROT|nr:hypothetical protein [Marinicauda salina]PWE18174.1 hypothetical protein DDZ18_00745 [Marinicauda salina]